MKLKFDQEVKNVIIAIADLPASTSDINILTMPGSILGAFERDLIQQRDSKKLPMKHWIRLRRQLAFIYEFSLMANTAGKLLLTNVSKKEPYAAALALAVKAGEEKMYQFLVDVIKRMDNGTLLQNPEFVRVALSYGVLYLSDHEIAKLVENNQGQ